MRFGLILLSCALTAEAASVRPAPLVSTITEFNAAVPLRDGVRLSANIFRPAAQGRYPAILLRTPYDKSKNVTASFQSFVNRGYVVIVQDVRGRYQSGGIFEPINQEVNDGDDTINWVAAQKWSDGAVGMFGGSYLGIAQWKAALSHNPHLKAIFPYVSGDDDYRDRFYSAGGAMKLGHRLSWLADNLRTRDYDAPEFARYVQALPLRTADQVVAGRSLDVWREAIDHPAYDDFWKRGSVREHLHDLRLPVYSVAGWYDNYAESDLDAFHQISQHSRSDRIMIGPWAHVFNTRFDALDFGKESQVSLRSEQIAWFDRYLKGEEADTPARAVRLFVMGTNQWRDEDEWPLARTRPVKFYLNSFGHANTAAGDGGLAAHPDRGVAHDTFTYDPRNPVPTAGGAVCCDPKVFPWGPKDQRIIEQRPDVLVYSTGPLTKDTEVTGAIQVVLHASSTATDTDFTAKLVDVYPDGRAINLCDGMLRVRYRESLSAPKLLPPGEVATLTIDAGVTSNVFRAGHRIRVEISSSNFPRFDRNANTGEAGADARHFQRATQTVYHDRERASYVLLPVIPVAPAEITVKRQGRAVARTAITVR